MKTAHSIARETVDTIKERTGLNLSPRSGSFFTCLITAAMGCLPCFIQGMIDCIAGGPEPPTGDYDPGDRKRCDIQ
jgi:hypothetical protein